MAGVALAAVAFVQVYKGVGPGQSLSCLYCTTAGPAPWQMKFWDLGSGDLCWWPGENNIWETPGSCPIMPMVKVGPSAVPTRVTWELAQGMKVIHRAHPEVNIPRGAILSGFSPSGCAAIPPASTTDHHHRNRSGGSVPPAREQTPPQIGQWQPQSKGELPSISSSGFGHNNIKQNPLQGDKGTSLWTNLTPRGHTPEQEQLRSFSLQNRNHKHRKYDKMRGQRSMV